MGVDCRLIEGALNAAVMHREGIVGRVVRLALKHRRAQNGTVELSRSCDDSDHGACTECVLYERTRRGAVMLASYT